jgi:uncharacterized protein YkwD
MHAVSVLSVLALVGSSFAAPVPEPNVVVVTKVATVVVTAGAEATPEAVQVNNVKPVVVYNTVYATAPVHTVTYGYGHGKPAPPASTPAQAKPSTYAQAKPSTYAPAPPQPKPSSVEAAKPSTYAQAKPSTYAPAPPQSSAAAPKPSASAAPAPPPSGGSGGGYMDTVNEWRSKMGLKTLTKDTKLEANAVKTCTDGNGKMVHELNPGTMGQVLAPGKESDFEHVFVGGWLCEVPSTQGLGNVCDQQSKGWTYQGQTGHNKILTSTSYSKIGCGMVNGIWGCDLA